MTNLESLKADILADGIIDADEAKQLTDLLYEDGEIDQEEADFLFELNDAVSGNNNAPEWEALFIKAICDFLLEDANSPGEIDAEEADWLVAKIGADGQVDELELKLLKALKEKAKDFPAKLQQLF